MAENNNIERAKVYQKELDRQVVAEAATGWMEANAGRTKYSGGDEVKIPKIAMDGLGDYDRGDGYPEGTVTLEYQTMRMTMDRGTSFNIDAMSADESGIDSLMGNVMGEFQRTHVIPEVDSYRLSKLYALAAAAEKVTEYTPAAATILNRLRADITAVKEIVGDGVPLVVHISMAVAQILDESDKLSRQLNPVEFARGEIKMRVRGLDDIPLLRTPSGRMKTAYTFRSGRIDGGNPAQFGYAAAPGAKQVNWLIVGHNAPIAVSKTDNIRLFDPQTYQKANAWHADYRKFHDLWVPESRLSTVWASAQA